MKRCLGALLLFCLGCGPSPVSHEGLDPSVARRHVALDGASNFRDFGGYETGDGRRVRWDTLYRSDNLADLTASDLDVISDLGLRLVCDFRSDAERQEEPSRLPQPDPPEVEHLTIADASFADIEDRIRSGDLEGLDLSQILVDGNRAFASRFSPQYRRLFERLLEPGNLPILVHCTAGKDRTGFAAAVVLKALGVDDDTIFEDFLLTNHYKATEIERILRLARWMSFFQFDSEVLRPLLGVRREYLEAGFDEIEKSHGSFDAYLRNSLDVDDGERAKLRELLLE